MNLHRARVGAFPKRQTPTRGGDAPGGPACKQLTVRVDSSGCRTRQGTITDQSDGRTIGRFILHRPAHP